MEWVLEGTKVLPSLFIIYSSAFDSDFHSCPQAFRTCLPMVTPHSKVFFYKPGFFLANIATTGCVTGWRNPPFHAQAGSLVSREETV